MSSTPTLTVLMPVYNTAQYLPEVIESILNQTFGDFEFLIINDGSKDNSQEVIERYAQKDQRIRSIYQENVGLVETLNRGISLARGSLIARQDGDDLSLPTRLEKQVEFLNRNPDCALLGTAIRTFGGPNPSKDIFYYTFHEQIADMFLLENSIAHGSVMFLKSAILEVGGYIDSPRTKNIEDYDLWARVARKFRVCNLDEILYRYRIHSESMSSKQASLQKENTRALAADIRNLKWYRDFWRVSAFQPDHWSHAPGFKSSSDPNLSKQLVYFQARTIALLLILREWKAAFQRLAVAFPNSPFRLPLNMLIWLSKSGTPALLRKWGVTE